MENKQFHVLVAVPTMGAMHPNLVATLVKWGRSFPANQVSFYFTFKVSPVDRARNHIVRYFFQDRYIDGKKQPPFTHLLFVDADTVPPADALKRLLSHDKDIVSGLTPIFRVDPKTGEGQTFDNCFTHFDTDEKTGKVKQTHMAQRGTGLQKIIRCGSSCILIKREVFEALEAPYYEFLYNPDHTEHIRSEDIHFCDKAKAEGFELWADTDVACQHYKEVML